MDKFFLAICFFLAVMLETTVIQLPFVLLLLLVTTIFYRTEWIFIVGLILGIIIDGLTFRHLGETSLFYIIFLLFVFLYEQKFELKTVAFAALMSFVGSFFFFLVFGSQVFILQLIAATIIGSLFFLAFSRIKTPVAKKYNVE